MLRYFTAGFLFIVLSTMSQSFFSFILLLGDFMVDGDFNVFIDEVLLVIVMRAGVFFTCLRLREVAYLLI